MICGTTVGTARPIDPFDVRTFNTADLVGMLGNCHELKEGTYTLCAQFYNLDKIAVSREVCKDFRVEATNVEYAPPTLITPENEKKFSSTQLEGPVTFRWTPLVPKPKEPVTYRLRVWQLMQGQTATQALRTNTPLIQKDVDNLTQTTVNSILTGPCKPPYLCDFIWNVQALNRAGKPMGNNNGTSEPYTFSATEEKRKGPDNVFPEDKKEFKPDEVKQSVTFRWTTLVPKPKEPVTYILRVWQLMQGQNGTQATTSNQPIVTKEVTDLNQVTVSGIYTGPCKPPYLCDFIWNVQAVTRDGTPGGISEPTVFKVTEEAGKCPANTLPEDKKKISSAEAKQAITFKWTKTATPGEAPTYRIKVWQLMQGQNGTQAMRSNPPIVTKEVRNVNEVSVSGIYTGPCKPPYLCDFIWAVEVMDASGRITCTGEPTTFSVTEETNTCPANVYPEDKKKLTIREAKDAITFKWTKTATPGEAPTYRIKVWQLMQGQNGTQAMRSNSPIVTKEVRDLNEVTVNGIYTGPCKPPYLCDFIWNIEMIDASGRSTCSSEPTVFKIANNDIDIQIDSLDVSCCKDGKQNIYLKIKNNLATPVKITQIKIDKINGVTASIIPSPLTPTLFVTIPGNGTQIFTGQINCIDTAKIIRIWVAAEDPADNAITETEVEADTLHCRCDACDEKNFILKTPTPGQITTTANSISFNQTITVTTTPPSKPIKTIEAELVYFEMIPENDQCIPCDKDAGQYGHFSNGSNSQQWTAPQTSLSINITTPNTPCCGTTFRWCIRYKITFKDCTVCSKVICYEKKKTGCTPSGGGTGTDNPNHNPPK